MAEIGLHYVVQGHPKRFKIISELKIQTEMPIEHFGVADAGIPHPSGIEVLFMADGISQVCIKIGVEKTFYRAIAKRTENRECIVSGFFITVESEARTGRDAVRYIVKRCEMQRITVYAIAVGTGETLSHIAFAQAEVVMIIHDDVEPARRLGLQNGWQAHDTDKNKQFFHGKEILGCSGRAEVIFCN